MRRSPEIMLEIARQYNWYLGHNALLPEYVRPLGLALHDVLLLVLAAAYGALDRLLYGWETYLNFGLVLLSRVLRGRGL